MKFKQQSELKKAQ